MRDIVVKDNFRVLTLQVVKINYIWQKINTEEDKMMKYKSEIKILFLKISILIKMIMIIRLFLMNPLMTLQTIILIHY